MKKMKMTMVAIAVILSACGQTVSPEETQTNAAGQTAETDAGDVLYEAFLKNEISVANPYVEGMNLTVIDDKEYESEFEDAQKKYAYVDVNGDENPELIFKISSYPSELMYILGIYDNQLVCFDVFETHTKNIAFGVYDYGFVWEVQDYDGFGMTFYTYTADGQRMQARHFTEENEADIAAYEGEEPEWIDWEDDGKDMEQAENPDSLPSLSDEIATEIFGAEEQEKEVEKKQEEAVTQLEMNEAAEAMYRLWDDTLNAV